MLYVFCQTSELFQPLICILQKLTESNAEVRLQDGFVHCVRLCNWRVINSCRVVAERHDRPRVASQSIIICSSWCVRCHQQGLLGLLLTSRHGRKTKNQFNLSVVRLWGVLDVALIVVFVSYYTTLRKMKWSTVAPDAHWSFPSLPSALRLPDQAIIQLISCSLTLALDDKIKVCNSLLRLSHPKTKYEASARTGYFSTRIVYGERPT